MTQTDLLPALDRMLAYFQSPINTDPAGKPALSLWMLDTAHVNTSVLVGVKAGLLTIWDTSNAFGLVVPLYQVDLSTLTMGQLAASLSTWIATYPYWNGAASVLTPTLAQTDRDWTNAPAAMLLETTGQISQDKLLLPINPLFIPPASALPLLAYTAPLWSFLAPIARELVRLETDATSVLQNLSLPTAAAPWVDAIAALYGVSRLVGDSDPTLIARTVRRVSKPACNNVAIADTLLALLGVTAVVRDSPALYTFAVRFSSVPAAPLASIVSTIQSVQLAGTGFTVEVPLPVLRPQYPYAVTGGAPRAIVYAQQDLILPTSITGTVLGACLFGANRVPTTIGPTTGLASSASLLTYTIANSLAAGQTIICQGAAPAAYNGTFTVNTASGTQFTVSSVANPGAGTVQGIISRPWAGPARTRVFAPQGTLTLYKTT